MFVNLSTPLTLRETKKYKKWYDKYDILVM